jgi:hypothetical protein
MSLRTKVALYIGVFLVLAGSVIFVLGPVLFASIAYPLPDKYRPSLAKWTNEYCQGVATPNFISALIYTESTWKEGARSYAGAVGLTQFIPSTARAVAQRLGVSPFEPDDLTKNADMSIRFGAYYICTRIKDYGGNVRKGLIAYNGGGGAVLAYERGAPIVSTLGYADKILSIEKAYDKIYGSWWKNLEEGVNSEEFELKPKTDFSLLVTVPILDFWKGLLSPPAQDIQDDGEINDSASGGLNNLWRLFVPGS